MKRGIYRHYKGNKYEVINIGINSETEEEQVIYKQLTDSDKYEKGTIWIRPKEMFEEEVELNGSKIKRFEFIEKN